MNLHIGGEWYLESDALNLILKQTYESKQKNSLGKMVTTERGYYRSLEQVLNAVLDKGISQSDAESLTDLKNDVADIRTVIEGFCVDRELGFSELRRENELLRQEIKRLTSKE